jgi:hypothetical protein
LVVVVFAELVVVPSLVLPVAVESPVEAVDPEDESVGRFDKVCALTSGVKRSKSARACAPRRRGPGPPSIANPLKIQQFPDTQVPPPGATIQHVDAGNRVPVLSLLFFAR